jgi:condensin complex subunit 1
VAADAKAALEAAQSQSQASVGDESQDIGAELGVGASSATADAELDLLKEAAEREVVSPAQLVGHYVPLVAAVCHSKRAMEAHPMLRSSAVLALAKIMIVDEGTCETNLPLIFSLVNNRYAPIVPPPNFYAMYVFVTVNLNCLTDDVTLTTVSWFSL